MEGDVDMYVYVLILSSCTYVNMYDDIILTTSKYIYIYIHDIYIVCHRNTKNLPDEIFLIFLRQNLETL